MALPPSLAACRARFRHTLVAVLALLAVLSIAGGHAAAMDTGPDAGHGRAADGPSATARTAAPAFTPVPPVPSATSVTAATAGTAGTAGTASGMPGMPGTSTGLRMDASTAPATAQGGRTACERCDENGLGHCNGAGQAAREASAFPQPGAAAHRARYRPAPCGSEPPRVRLSDSAPRAPDLHLLQLLRV